MLQSQLLDNKNIPFKNAQVQTSHGLWIGTQLITRTVKFKPFIMHLQFVIEWAHFFYNISMSKIYHKKHTYIEMTLSTL